MSNYGPRYEPSRGGNFRPPNDRELKAIIQDGDAKTLVESAQIVGKSLAEMRLAASQIRGIFGSVRQIQMKWPPGADPSTEKASIRQLLLLKPKLAYQAKRDSENTRGQAVESLKQVLVPAIDLVTNREQFTRFAEYFEAILAYHKAEGGKD